MLARVIDARAARRRAPAVGGALLVAAYLAVTLALAARDRLWNDELFTYYFARLPDLATVWDRLATGVEQTPPFYYALTRASLWAFGGGDVALRLPGLLGVALGCACVFVLVARRSTKVHGLIGALLLLGTQAAVYAHEARPYGLVLGLAAAALLCWHLRVANERSTAAVLGMAASLTLAVASHYYAVLVLLPLALGEAARTYLRRRLDVPVLAGFAVALVPLALAVPLIQGARRYSGSFWTDYGWGSAADFAGWLVRTSAVPPWLASRDELALIVWAVAGAAVHALVWPRLRTRTARRTFVLASAAAALGVCASLVAGGLSFRDGAFVAAAVGVLLGYALLYRLRPDRRTPVLPAPELLAAGAFLALPLAAVVLAKASTGAYTERYVLPSALGLAVLLPLALHRLDGARARASGLVALVLLVLVARVFWYQGAEAREDNRILAAKVAALEQVAAQTDLPIAVAHPHDALELAYAAPPGLARRLVHLSSSREALRYIGTASTEDGLVVLSGFSPVVVRGFDAFLSSGRPFLLLLNADPGNWNWVVPALEEDGRTLRPYRPAHGLMLESVAPCRQQEGPRCLRRS